MACNRLFQQALARCVMRFFLRQNNAAESAETQPSFLNTPVNSGQQNFAERFKNNLLSQQTLGNIASRQRIIKQSLVLRHRRHLHTPNPFRAQNMYDRAEYS